MVRAALILNVRWPEPLDIPHWRSRFFEFCFRACADTRRKSFGHIALANRVKFEQRSNATKWERLVRTDAALALDSSSGCENAGD
jgi:hypothetical protein